MCRFIVSIIVVLLFSCREAGKQSDVIGTYLGEVNCSTCNGLKSKVTFLKDGTVRIGSISQEMDDVEPLTEHGNWTYSDGVIIIFTGRDSLYYRQLSPSTILSLHRDRTNTSLFVEDYTLEKLP